MATGSRGGKIRVILLPGMFSTIAEDWEPHFEAIVEAGFEPVGIDWPGHGNTESLPDTMTLQSLVDYILTKLDTITDEPVLIWGYSLGGYVALELERQSPSRCWAIWMHATKFFWSDDEINTFRSSFDSKVIALARKEALEKLFGNRWLELAKRNSQLFEDIVEFGLSLDDIDEIRLPVLVSVGDQDDLVAAEEVEQLADELIMGEPQIIPGVRHSLHTTRSSLIIPVAEEFSHRVLAG